MKKKHIISIPEPCSEDWSAMPINGKGRDCSKCERNIRDFTKMSDSELIGVLTSEQKVCGRFTADQLDRPLLRENRGLLPTFNLYAVAAGFGALITFPAFASDFQYEKTPVNLVHLVQENTTLSTSIQDEVRDSLTHIYVIDNIHYRRISGANIILINDQGEIIDAIQTDDEGYASYPFDELEKHRIHEIRIIATDEFEESTLIWTPDGDQVMIVTLESNAEQKEAKPIYLGYVSEPRF
ncbi:MAG: hypothetical protein NXI10_06415 [bacterium]|nr:hypothetical protein [bacterium]